MTAQHDLNWGFSTLGCHDLDLENICELAVSRGVHALEIRSLSGRMDLPAYLDEVYATPGPVQNILNARKQQIVALNSSFSLIGAAEESCRELLAFVRWAELLNIPYIRIFGGGSMEKDLTGEELTRAAASLDWWENIRQQNGWQTRLVLETHDGFSSGQRCLLLQKYARKPLDIIWDTHHTWKLGGETASQTWDQIAHMIRHVHIKDSISVPSARHPFTYVLPGTGEFPAQEVLSILRENRYRGVVSLEWERKWHPYLPSLDQALDALVSSGWKRPAAPRHFAGIR